MDEKIPLEEMAYAIFIPSVDNVDDGEDFHQQIRLFIKGVDFSNEVQSFVLEVTPGNVPCLILNPSLQESSARSARQGS